MSGAAFHGGSSHVWHPYTKHSTAAGGLPVIVRGEGVYLFDEAGNRYLDAISSWWCCNLGHGHPRIAAAIRAQAGTLEHSILGGLSHPRAEELADALARLMPDGRRHVLFGSDGASAVEAALKIAVQFWNNTGRPGKTRFACLHDAYHGDTLGAVSVGYVDTFHRPFRDMVFPVHQAESPCCTQCRYDKSPASCDVECMGSMEDILDRNSDKLAAVIVEPLCQGAGGMRMHSPRYLRRLGKRCREHEVLLILDEIAMGMGRTGSMFAFEQAGIDPDIVCVGKGLSAGSLPISATVVRDRLFDTFSDGPEDHTFYHGHTFAGNPIAAAAAVETLAVYEEDSIVDRSRALGRVLAEELAPLSESGQALDVRCVGMVGAVELGRAPGDPDAPALAAATRSALMEEGILTRPLGNVIYLMLPLVTPEDVLVEAVRALRNAVG